MRPVSNACSEDTSEFPGKEVNADLGNPGFLRGDCRQLRLRGDALNVNACGIARRVEVGAGIADDTCEEKIIALVLS